MHKLTTSLLVLVACSAALFSPIAGSARADEKTGEPQQKFNDFLNQGGASGGFGATDAKLTVAFQLNTANPGDVVTLSVRLDLPPGHYTYPLKAPVGATTKIRIGDIAGLEPLAKEFAPEKPAKEGFDDLLKEATYKHIGGVTWKRKYRVTAAKDFKAITASGTIRYQMCNEDVCLPPKTVPIVATLTFGNQKRSFPFVATVQPQLREEKAPISFHFELKPADAKPGDTVTVSLKAKLDEGWHAFALTHEKGGTGIPVTIDVQLGQGLEPIGKGWRPDTAPKVGEDAEGKTLLEHVGAVTWSRQFKVADSAKPGAYGIRGTLRYQICEKGMCLTPKRVAFALGELSNESAAPKGSNDINATPFPGGASSEESGGSLAWFLFAAFLGGMILNVMPCVLPVIAIKVMSFVQQAGESKQRILALNVAYSVGVISVFLVLATLAILLKLGWGGLFQKPEFNLVMACIIFAMGLSLLGVFEIPIPGMIGSAAGGQHQEGLHGALMTGIFATLLATPCTGPFLGTTLAWSVKQPVPVTYLLWGLMGLGMASPYLLLGFFPGLIKFLPKPGNWMVRFKEIAGFILMGTVVFFISFLAPKFVVPLLVMLMGIALGLWMIGNLYDINSKIRKKATVRVSALALTIGICGFGYSLTMESEHELPWKEFNDTNLQAALDKNQTVLVDFTADWCTNCKVNEKFALNRKGTLDFVKEHNVKTLMADYTNESADIKRWLDKFETDGVPLTVIFPANRPDKPIVLRALYSNATLLEKLREAVEMPKLELPAGVKQASLP